MSAESGSIAPEREEAADEADVTPAIASEPQVDPEPSRAGGGAVVEVTRQGDRGDRGPREPRRYKDNWDRDSRDRDDVRPAEGGLPVPEGIEYSQLDVDARAGLRSLPKSLAELVGKHLVAAGMLLEEDPERALKHARYARERAARVAVVREAAGIAAYHAGEWSEALSELRAVRRMSGGSTHIAVMADCERALGRPERALELAKEAGADVDPAVAVELRIVSAGARRDMGQLDAAVVALQGADLDPQVRKPWSARLFYAYADNLEAAGRDQDAIRWFLNAAQADDDEDTDAAERAFALGADESEIAAALPGETIEIDETPAPDNEPEETARATPAERANASEVTASTDAAGTTSATDAEPEATGSAANTKAAPAHGDAAEGTASTDAADSAPASSTKAGPAAANVVEEIAEAGAEAAPVRANAAESAPAPGVEVESVAANAAGVSGNADTPETDAVEEGAGSAAVAASANANTAERDGSTNNPEAVPAIATESEDSTEATTGSAAVVEAQPAEGASKDANAVEAVSSEGDGAVGREQGIDRR
ncbi:hypothetical protein ACOBQX_09845 [Actinokineospora sp. G85]|uniref:hypothetical protein n=1 Tax=Actinokineospora sp. G85 TaxID=3406626 RepID=UPI003C730F8C